MNMQEALDILHEHEAYVGWRKDHDDAFLSHVFRMMEKDADDWQFGYYSAKDDRITTFVVGQDQVEMRPDEEVFKKEHTQIQPLDLDKASLSHTQIVQQAKEFQGKEYPKDKPMKIISILQNLEDAGQVWNLTLVTQAFNTLNLKLDPSTGEVTDHKVTSIFSFRQG